MTTRDEITRALTDDGDTLELPDGRTLRVRTEPDDMTIMDEQGEGMWCGRLEWVRANRDYWPARYSRPDGFDGAAEIIRREDGEALWWDVPTDLRGDANRENRDAVRREITELLNCGYRVVVLELCNGEDAYGRPIVESFASVGAVGWSVSLGEFIPDLADELGVL